MNRIKGLFTALTAAFAGMALAGAALPGVAMAAAKPLPEAMPGGHNWNATVAKTDHDSYVLGNPEAPIKLVEFISYTCPHCAHFEEQSDAPLRIGMIAKGTGSIEVRSFLRNPIDLTVTMLAHCGKPSQFFMNHEMFLRRQQSWIQPMIGSSPSQQKRWTNPDLVTRNRYIATDFGLYEMMSERGYNRVEIDRCLADSALAKRLQTETLVYEVDPTCYDQADPEACISDRVKKLKEFQAAVKAGTADPKDNPVAGQGVQGTPSFILGGVLLAGTYDWDTLRPQVEARLDQLNTGSPSGDD
ncbi:thioredoxin domain-containing protein [Novosphingobium sp. ZN18A2]|uniref:thioredoxin domain-containing protein n=1 Tax=Novosphingobium sp. ZN18A2 TaxID=3079861 RepID=UPI0030CAF107